MVLVFLGVAESEMGEETLNFLLLHVCMDAVSCAFAAVEDADDEDDDSDDSESPDPLLTRLSVCFIQGRGARGASGAGWFASSKVSSVDECAVLVMGDICGIKGDGQILRPNMMEFVSTWMTEHSCE